jgi:hypothetical protein
MEFDDTMNNRREKIISEKNQGFMTKDLGMNYED